MDFSFCFFYFIGQKTLRGSFLIYMLLGRHFFFSFSPLFFIVMRKKKALVPLQLLPGETQKSHAGLHGSGWWSGAQGRGKEECIYLQPYHSGEGRRMHVLEVRPQTWEYQENRFVGKLSQFSWVICWSGCLSELPAGQVLSVQSSA